MSKIKGIDMYLSQKKYTIILLFSLEKCTGVITDGAKAMICIKYKHWFIREFLKKIGHKCVFIHCIIHQKVLCGKIIKTNL